jgi:hypothetical protein
MLLLVVVVATGELLGEVDELIHVDLRVVF